MDKNSAYFLALKQVAKHATSTKPLKKALTAIAKRTSQAMQATGCSILLLNPKKDYLYILANFGLSDLYLRKGTLNVYKSIPDIMRGEITTVIISSNSQHAQYPEAAEVENIRSIIGLPLFQDEEIIGELRLYAPDEMKISSIDKEFLTAVSSLIVLTIEKGELHNLISRSTRKGLPQQPKPVDITTAPGSVSRTLGFSHPSEEEFAKLLDFYRIEWLYEPKSFPLSWEGAKITEMFTPDFYLPELDLYIELTTLRQKLITEKNRKVRRIKELHPEINIKLLNKSDYHKLLAKYGYGPLGGSKIEGINEILFSHTQIERRISTLARSISQDYSGRQLVLVGVLKGVICFLSDLMQHISIPVSVEFMAISYYGAGEEKAVKITKDLDASIAGCDVLMVEDIVDTGMTLNYLLNHLYAHNPASLRVCTLLDKRIRRLVNIPIDYIGFEIPDEFIVGYGLDYRGQYRNLPFIGALSPESY